ncbi:MAG: isoprenylcysteine carboxylmethyltransferase family protein [Gemmatimonadota bacterium]|nr:MAG: isoprenylcysteine carboxylmethyltransferase family protein [Gemmatimonadota bacterium]
MGSDRGRRRPQLLEWVAGLSTVALLVADLFVERGTNDALRAIGVVALLLAPVFFVPPFFLLKKHGRVEEGRSFVYTTGVVDRGVYGIVRHPQYLGYILLALGFALRTQNIVTWALGAVAVAFFYLHALTEERFCAGQLGSEYAAYMSRVPRFNFILGLFIYLRSKIRSTPDG